MRNPRKKALFAIIGDPVEHSLSPVMYNAAFEALGFDYEYRALRVKRDELKDAVNDIRKRGFIGVNVTTPHKVAIIRFLNSLDPLAEAIGSVNTVHNREGTLIGYNTDGIGALRSLKERVPDLEEKGVVILGAGGAARAIAFHLAGRCKSLTILNRTEERAIELATSLRKKLSFPAIGAKLGRANLRKALSSSDVLIHATTVGMAPNVEETLVTKEMLRPELVVFDIVYTPMETKLLREAKAVGAKTIGGIDMLIYQGARSFEIWTGRKAPIEVMRKAVIEALEASDIFS